MCKFVIKSLRWLQIIEDCPNCESAWTGGHPNPQRRTTCIVCGGRDGEITGWVWGVIVDPFCWIGQWIVARNLKRREI